MSFNTGEFITEIEKRPAIWDSSKDAFSNKFEKLNAWEEMCKRFHTGFQNLTNEEKTMVAVQLQRKWKSIRDSYTRELMKQRKETSLGAVSSGRKQYVFFKQLSFLKPIANSKASTSNIRSEDEKEDEVRKKQPDPSPADQDPDPSSPAPPVPSRKRQVGDDVQLLKTLQESLQRKMCKESEIERDEDRLFMLSLVPELKRLPDDLRLDVKCEILNMIRKARQQCVREANIPTTKLDPQSSNFNLFSQNAANASSQLMASPGFHSQDSTYMVHPEPSDSTNSPKELPTTSFASSSFCDDSNPSIITYDDIKCEPE